MIKYYHVIWSITVTYSGFYCVLLCLSFWTLNMSNYCRLSWLTIAVLQQCKTLTMLHVLFLGALEIFFGLFGSCVTVTHCSSSQSNYLGMPMLLIFLNQRSSPTISPTSVKICWLHSKTSQLLFQDCNACR